MERHGVSTPLAERANSPRRPGTASEAVPEREGSQPTRWEYEPLRNLVRGSSFPLVLVDLDRFDRNLAQFATRAAAGGKRLRLASKSIRVPALLRRALNLAGPVGQGVFCYGLREAAYLAQHHFDDLLVGYPQTSAADFSALLPALRGGQSITLMIDSCEHVEKLARLAREADLAAPLRVCIDADVSWRPWGLHVGAQRSPVRTLSDFERLLHAVLRQPSLQLAGVMAYEAQLSGIPDWKTASPLRNLAMRVMKAGSRPDVRRKREQIAECLARRGVSVEFFNGGGTGSFSTALEESCLSEITIGSGLLQPHLFDGYRDCISEPALCVALEVTRCPQDDRVTCQGGGFIASGPAGADRLPLPVLPAGIRAESREGFGEVQTPFVLPNEMRGKLAVGDPVFVRPAKSGEVAERFNDYAAVSGGEIVARLPTYRGLGQCFH